MNASWKEEADLAIQMAKAFFSSHPTSTSTENAHQAVSLLMDTLQESNSMLIRDAFHLSFLRHELDNAGGLPVSFIHSAPKISLFILFFSLSFLCLFC